MAVFWKCLVHKPGWLNGRSESLSLSLSFSRIWSALGMLQLLARNWVTFWLSQLRRLACKHVMSSLPLRHQRRNKPYFDHEYLTMLANPYVEHGSEMARKLLWCMVWVSAYPKLAADLGLTEYTTINMFLSIDPR